MIAKKKTPDTFQKPPKTQTLVRKDPTSMKTPTPLLRLLGLTAAASLAFLPSVRAADGTWTALAAGDASGTYSTATNWAGNVVADGSGFTADFSTLDITTTSTVTLDGVRTLGNLVFGDTNTATAASWVFGNSANTLTLAGTTPTITVNALGAGASATVDAPLDGTSGLTKAGSGLLILSGANTYTGTTEVNAGTLRLGNADGVGTGSDGVNVASGAVFDVNGFSLASTNKTVTISGNGSGAGALVNTGASSGFVRQLNFSTASTVGGTARLDVGFGATAISGGTNTLTKTGSNQFTVNAGTVTVGTIDVQQGTLSVVNNSGGLGDTTFGTSVAGGATLVFYQNGVTAMSVAENITLANNAELKSSRSQLAMTLTGNVALTGGTADINVVTAVGGDASTFTISGNLTGAGGVNKTGSGLLILTGANSYTNGTTVSAGTLQGNTGSLQGAITNNAALIFDQASTGTYGSILSGSGTLEKTGVGNLTLSGSNTFSGATTVSQGTLTLGDGSALGTTAGNTTVASGATIDLNGQNIGGEEVRINGSGVGGNGALVNTAGTSATGLRLTAQSDATIGGSGRIDTVFGGTIINAGTNTLTKEGTGSFIINSGATSMGTLLINEGTVTAVNTATAFGDTNFGTSVANGASLQFFNGSGSAIANSEAFTLAGGAELATTTANSDIVLNGAIALTGGTTTVRVESQPAGLILNGVISGSGGLDKISGGSLQLGGVNTYTGNTTVTGGSLALADNAEMRFVIGASGVNNGIDGAGILSLDGDFRFDLTGAGTTVGNSWQIVDVASLTETFGGTFQALSTLGAFSNSGGVWSITENGADYEFAQSTGYLTVVPEPSTSLLVGLGLSALLFRRRRGRRP